MSIVNCHAGLVRFTKEDNDGRSILLYSGPTGSKRGTEKYLERSRLPVRASFDEGKTWPIARIITEGYAGYSDLAIAKDGTILCVYGVDTFDASKSKHNVIRLSWDAIEN